MATVQIVKIAAVQTMARKAAAHIAGKQLHKKLERQQYR